MSIQITFWQAHIPDVSRAAKAALMGLLAWLAAILLAGCAAQSPADPARLSVHEYALVEQSQDNPDHAGFQDRVPAAVAGGSGTQAGRFAREVQAPNRALAPFGYRLDANPTPPFSAFALYSGDRLIQRDIARFWPVTISDTGDFLLPYQTITGEQVALTAAGLSKWPGQVDVSPSGRTPPAYYGKKLAYAQVKNPGGSLAVYAGDQVLYSSPSSPDGLIPNSGAAAWQPQDLHTWTDTQGADHWAVEALDSHGARLLIDGEDVNHQRGADEAFGLTVISGQPLYFFTRQGRTHLNYTGHDLPYQYDRVVHDGAAETALFNPGSDGVVSWFYALRDGVWYYVEVSAK